MHNLKSVVDVTPEYWNLLNQMADGAAKLALAEANPDLDEATVRDFARRIHISRLSIKEYRENIRNKQQLNFALKKEVFRRNAEREVKNRVFPQEGRKYDFHLSVDFGLELRAEVTRHTHFRSYGGKTLVCREVSVQCSPAMVNRVNERWAHFTKKSEVQFVFDAEELIGHPLNDYRIKVYRLTCFGTESNSKEPEMYQYYLTEHETGVYAHGASPSIAHSLLNRRLKAEVLKRLQD